jgi:hypothetical protein
LVSKQVVVLCRHGVRLPEHSFPKFTFFPINKLWWGKFGGQLTPVGVEQMRRVGEQLGWIYSPLMQPSIGKSVFDEAYHFHQEWEQLTNPFNKGVQPRSSLHEHFRKLIRPVHEKVQVRYVTSPKLDHTYLCTSTSASSSDPCTRKCKCDMLPHRS